MGEQSRGERRCVPTLGEATPTPSECLSAGESADPRPGGLNSPPRPGSFSKGLPRFLAHRDRSQHETSSSSQHASRQHQLIPRLAGSSLTQAASYQVFSSTWAFPLVLFPHPNTHPATACPGFPKRTVPSQPGQGRAGQGTPPSCHPLQPTDGISLSQPSALNRPEALGAGLRA